MRPEIWQDAPGREDTIQTHFDKSMPSQLMFRPADYAYVDWQPTAKSASERMVDESGSKLLAKTVGAFRNNDRTSHTITIKEESKPNVILI